MSFRVSKGLIFSLIAMGFGLGGAFAVGETVVRVTGTEDVNGNFYFRGYRTRPYRYRGEALQSYVDRYLAGETHWIEYHPLLGWVDVTTDDGPDLRQELRGIRRDTTTYLLEPTEGLLRVVLVGDSYTKSAEVGYEDSWGLALQERLNSNGVPSEVLNLGVGAYGMDQAYLRWSVQGRALRPDVLVFGFQPENLKRNVNVLRPFYTRNVGVFFSKPRFALQGDSLVLRNVPTLGPQQIPAFVDDFWDHPLSEVEAFRRREYEFVPFWMHSRLLASAEAIWRRKFLHQRDFPDSTFFNVESEGAELGLEILDQFEKDAREDGVAFVVLHLPRAKQDVLQSLDGVPIAYSAVLGAIKKRHTVIDVMDALTEAAGSAEDPSVIHMRHGHYSALANRIVGELAADSLASWIASGGLELDRRVEGF